MLTNQAITAVSLYKSKFDIYDRLIKRIPNVNLLAGTIIQDMNRVINHIAEGGDRSIFKNGAKTIRLVCDNYKQKNNSGGLVSLSDNKMINEFTI